MQVDFFGANCLRLTSEVSLLFDDLTPFGGKSPATKEDIVCQTQAMPAPECRLLFDTPGEYEVGDCRLTGVAARTKDDRPSTIFRVISKGINLVVLGHPDPNLSDSQVEALGVVNVLFIPVGGGDSLSPTEALSVVKRLEPQLVVPTYWADSRLKFESPLVASDEFLKVMSAEVEKIPKSLKLKRQAFGEQLKVKLIEP